MSAAPAHLAQLETRLRAELDARPLSAAKHCPSWPSYVRALRERAEEDKLDGLLAEALALALEPARVRGHAINLRAAVRAVLRHDPGPESELRERLWQGELGWSVWLGPFVLAHAPALIFDPEDDSPDDDAEPSLAADALRPMLGPLARFLLPSRALDPSMLEDWLLELDTPGRLALSAPAGARPAVGEHLALANDTLYADRAVEASALMMRWVHDFISHWDPPPPPPPLGCAVVEVREESSVHSLHLPTLEQLSSLVYVGPSELLDAPLAIHSRRSWPAPAPDYEAQRRTLWQAQPGLFAALERELAERPLSEASTCPSWVVFVDLLWSAGEELLAQWLRAALEDPVREVELGHELTRGPFSHPRKHLRYDLHKQWKQRGLRSHWFGPFVLRYFDPSLHEGLGAEDVQNLLGMHAALLPRHRVYTGVEREWIDDVLRPRTGPLLAPLPAPRATAAVAHLLSAQGEREQRMLGSVRVAASGEVLDARPEQREIMSNMGPTAADRDAVAVLCCETAEDLARHAARLAHLDTFAHVIVLGTPQLLERWPHASITLREWGTPRSR